MFSLITSPGLAHVQIERRSCQPEEHMYTERKSLRDPCCLTAYQSADCISFHSGRDVLLGRYKLGPTVLLANLWRICPSLDLSSLFFTAVRGKLAPPVKT